jgi:hypothetical protein
VATPGVDFFRVDRSGPTKRLLTVASTLVLVGMTAIGAHLVNRLGPDLARLVSLAGGLTVAVGLITGFGGMAMFLFENVYLLIKEEGIVCHVNGTETLIDWSHLNEVRVDGMYLVLERTSAEAVRWFAGKDTKQLQGRIDEAWRKAKLGILKLDS